MNKITIILVLIVLFLTACRKTDSDSVSLEEVLSSINEQQLTLKEIEVSDNNIFGMKLNGVRPDIYDLNGKMLFIYIFNSTQGRKKGFKDFTKKTETFNLVSYNYYEFKNVLVFYVHSHDMSKDVPFDKEIQRAVDDL